MSGASELRNVPDGIEVSKEMVDAACEVLDESGLLEWGVDSNPVTVRRMIEAALRVRRRLTKHPEAAAARKTALEDAAKVAERIGRKNAREADRLHKRDQYNVDAYEQFECLAEQAFFIAGRIRANRERSRKRARQDARPPSAIDPSVSDNCG